MIRINRTTEYGLIALNYMSEKQQSADSSSEVLTSAREISERYTLPFEITAKTLIRLKDLGVIQAAHGAKGGYMLVKPLTEISLGKFVEMMEGSQGIVACTDRDQTNVCECEYGLKCEIQSFMVDVNERVSKFLDGIPLSEMIKKTEAK
jgi:Rrf2 family protein